MLELTKKPHTKDVMDICLRVPVEDVERITQAIQDVLSKSGDLVREINDEGEELFSVDEIFPHDTPGDMLKGGRYKEGMTQEQLAKASGIPRRHISEMENGRRPIGKERAKRLAEVLRVDYRVFL